MNGPFRESALQSGLKAVESLIEIRKRNQQAQKNRLRGGFFSFQVAQRMPGRYSLVPRGRLELPLLSETDFESAASTGSATGAMAAEYRDAGRPGQSKVRW